MEDEGLLVQVDIGDGDISSNSMLQRSSQSGLNPFILLQIFPKESIHPNQPRFDLLGPVSLFTHVLILYHNGGNTCVSSHVTNIGSDSRRYFYGRKKGNHNTLLGSVTQMK